MHERKNLFPKNLEKFFKYSKRCNSDRWGNKYRVENNCPKIINDFFVSLIFWDNFFKKVKGDGDEREKI